MRLPWPSVAELQVSDRTDIKSTHNRILSGLFQLGVRDRTQKYV